MWSAVDKALDHLSVAVERVSKGMNEQFGGDYILFLFFVLHSIPTVWESGLYIV